MGHQSEWIGYAASLAVLATFLMPTMYLLRLAAIMSDCLFIAYRYEASVHPVLILHLVLLPVNIARLIESRSNFGMAARSASWRLPGGRGPAGNDASQAAPAPFRVRIGR